MPRKTEQEVNILNSINKLLIVISLLVVIAVAAAYLVSNFTDFFKSAPAPEVPVQRIQDDQKDAVLSGLQSSSNANVNEIERYDALESLSANAEVDASQRNAALNSLR